MNTNALKRFICGCAILGCVLNAAAWTVNGGVATIGSGETKIISTTNDFIVEGSRLSRISLSAGDSIIEFADDFVSGDWLTFGGSGRVNFGTSTFNTYYVNEGSPQAYILNGGTVTFDGPINCANGSGWFQVRNASTLGGTVLLNTNGSKFAQFRFIGGVGVRCGATDALYSSAGTGGLCFNGGTGTGPGLDLNGYSTRVKTLNGDDIQVAEGNTSFALVKSASPATLQANGVKVNNCVYPFKFEGKASFLYNGSGQTLNLVNIVSTSSGDLGVASGTLVMKWGAGWSGESVTVTGGVFKISSSKTFSNSNVCFTVKSPGCVVLEQDVYVDRLFVGDNEIVAGRKYTASELGAQFSGEGSISVRYIPKDPVYDTYIWTSTTEGESLAAAGVWKDGKTPDLSDGGATLVFSEGGASATATGDVSVNELQFLSTFPFSLGSASGRTISIAGGITAVEASQAVTSSVSANIAMTAANTAGWTIGANATLRLDGDVSSAGSATLPVTGDGSLCLNGDNSSLARPFEFSCASVVVGSKAALGSTSRTSVVGANTLLRFDCLTNDVPIQVTGLVSGKNRPNIAGRDSLVLNGKLSVEASSSYIDIGKLRIRGGIEGDGNINFYVFGGNTAWIEGPPITLTGGVGARFTGHNAVLHLAATGNEYTAFGVCVYSVALGSTATLVCENDQVLNSGKIFTFGRADVAQSGVLDLNGHDQRVRCFGTYAYGMSQVTEKGSGYGVVTSAVPATVTISGRPYYAYASQCAYYGRSATGYFSPTNSVAFRGMASLVFEATGSEETCFVNGRSDTTGSLTVNSGRLVFDWGAGWTAATNVTINGGVLRVAAESAPCAFGSSQGRSKAVMRINGDGILELDEADGIASVKALALDGVFVQAGVYGGSEAGLDAAHTLPKLAGRGRLLVRLADPNPGFPIIFR
ncbi:MAG: hypothetical protein IJI35_03650 [Kiritimatiellae bacterium]|nr:hypothetical protein [Kiritimatiellia bacterium]